MKKTIPTEKQIEKSILEWLSAMRLGHFWKNNSVGVFDPIKKTYRRSNSTFAERGSADILGCIAGRFVAIEVKRTDKGVLSIYQKTFLKKITEAGGIAFVATSIDDVKNQLKNYGTI